MKVAIIDADLIGRKNHRFPNLASMKISGWHKEQGDDVILKRNYSSLDNYDLVYISKVFTDTEINEEVLGFKNVRYGGTGFFYDKAEPLPYHIEHYMPDYHLYDDWVKERIVVGKEKPSKLTYYTDYSIGFLTRGCFRQCDFCVNRNKKMAVKGSPLEEFLDKERPKICLQDDNFFACKDWRELLFNLKKSNKRFQFKQGLDERLLTEEKIHELFDCNTEGDLIFAFDNIHDKKIIEEKLTMIRTLYPNSKKALKFYTFVGFDRENKWDSDFWKQDIFDCFERIRILMGYGCVPYITRFNRCQESPHKGMYINLARWCNQPSLFKKKSFREFCTANGEDSACYKYMIDFELRYPSITTYFDLKYEEVFELELKLKELIIELKGLKKAYRELEIGR